MITISIEKLVRWCVVDEWPKEREAADRGGGIGSGWGATASYVKLLTVIDENRYGVVPDVGGSGDVHPDAVVVGEALRRLCADGGPILAEIDPSWLVGDLVWRVGERQGDDAARAALGWLMPRAIEALGRVVAIGADGGRRSIDGLDHVVVRSAVLGAPSWRASASTWDQLRHQNGTPVWRCRVRRAVDWNEDGEAVRWGEAEIDAPRVDGRRPADAYPAMAMMPWDPAVLIGRARHIVWRAALRGLAAAVDGLLTDHVVIDDDGTSMPWLSTERGGRVLADLMAQKPLISACEKRGRRRA